MFDQEKFSISVYSLRESVGLSLREMAHHIGISASTLSRIENGHKPDIDSFVLICAWAEGWEDIHAFIKKDIRDTEGLGDAKGFLAIISEAVTPGDIRLSKYQKRMLLGLQAKQHTKDAALIAAAPDMLKALQIILDDTCGCSPVCQCNYDATLRVWKEEAKELAKAAIEKYRAKLI